jgi:threonine/homoserine/homoserine lactone efflux protein
VIDHQLVAFAVVATIVTVIPGADMALIARSVLTFGRPAAYVTSLGICAGLILHAVASALGLSAILMTSATLFTAVKLAGAGYLVVLGVQSLRHARAAAPGGDDDGGARDGRAARTVGARRAFVQGLLSNVLNPKVAVFYLTLLPQFVRPEDPVLARSLLLASIHIALGLSWLVAYAYFLGRLGAVLRRPRVRRALESVTGALLIGLGVRLAWERR